MNYYITFTSIILFFFAVHGRAVVVENVSFQQRGEISQLIIELDEETFAEKFHSKDDQQIILDIKNASAPARVVRPIDTSEFSGSSVYISGYPKPGSPGDLRFAIQLRDNVDSKLDIQGNKIILAIENRYGAFDSVDSSGDGAYANISGVAKGDGVSAITEADTTDILENMTQSSKREYMGRKISINVRSIPVGDLLMMIGETAGFNMVIDEEAAKRPPITLNLSDIPWDEALDTVLSLSRLHAKKHANILAISTIEKARKEKEDEIDSQKKMKKEEPLVTKIFPISFAKLEELMPIVKDYVTERGKISNDARTNNLIVKDVPDSIERVKKIIELLDTATPQVLIEAKIVEASEEFNRRIGFNSGNGVTYNGIGTVDGARSGFFTFSPAPTLTDPSVMGVNITTLRRLSNLNFSLQLMEQESIGKIISTPKVITQNRQAATITTQDQTSFPLQTIQPTGQALITWQNIQAALTLNVTPQVTNDGSIALEIDITKQSFKPPPAPEAPPNLQTNTIQTSVLVDNGSTVVIGGMYQFQRTESHSGIPFLKDIPLIGWLFRTLYNPSESKNELVIFLTPRVINQAEAGLGGQDSGF